jgi:hypothetical protein
MQDDIGQQGRDHTALGGAPHRVCHLAFLQHPSLPPRPNQAQDAHVSYTSADQLHQQVMINRVKVRLQIHVHNVDISRVDALDELSEGHTRRSLRAEAIGAWPEVRLKEGFNHQLDRHLDHPVLHGRDTEGAGVSWLARLGDRDPADRGGPIPVLAQFFGQLAEKPSLPVLSDRVNVHLVRTRRTLVGLHPPPGFVQDVWPTNLIVEERKPPAGLLLGHAV